MVYKVLLESLRLRHPYFVDFWVLYESVKPQILTSVGTYVGEYRRKLYRFLVGFTFGILYFKLLSWGTKIPQAAWCGQKEKRKKKKSNCCLFFSFLFYFFLFYLFIFLSALGLRCCAWAFSSCRQRGLLFAVHRLLIAVASLVAEHAL